MLNMGAGHSLSFKQKVFLSAMTEQDTPDPEYYSFLLIPGTVLMTCSSMDRIGVVPAHLLTINK